MGEAFIRVWYTLINASRKGEVGGSSYGSMKNVPLCANLESA
jgi:hypothetical protein